jgi:glycopeptide antibiotics resistance protein
MSFHPSSHLHTAALHYKHITSKAVMKVLPKTLLAVYLSVLLWLLLFKLSVYFGSVIGGYHVRVINLIPFAGVSKSNPAEVLYNVLVFIPLGLLLRVNFSQTNIWRKLLFVLFLSTSVEITQYALAIGRTDITDVITNTFGGYLGLALYDLGQRRVDKERLNSFIVVVGTILVTVFLLLRFFVLKVRY